MKRKTVGVTVELILVLLVSIVGSSQVPNAAAGPNIIVVHADSSAPVSELLATGLFSTVDVFDAGNGTPTLSDLIPYDAVLAYSNVVPADAVGLGNILADYVDAGGRLVLATYAFSLPWSIQGRITDAGYSPLRDLGLNGAVSGNLVVLDHGDPIFAEIDLGALTYFHNSNFSHPGLDGGATLLATDGAGVNMIARNASGQVIGVNLFPGNCCGGNNAEFYQLLGNALVTTTRLAADLSVTASNSPNPVEVGSTLIYTVTVSNTGPHAATGVVLTDPLPPSLSFVSAISPQGTCTADSGTVTCHLGELANGANVTVPIVVIPTTVGIISNTVSVTSEVDDPDLTNNGATVSTTVWSMLFRNADASLGINLDTGEFTLTYLVDEEIHTCSGRRARVDDGFLSISDRCAEDLRDQIRAFGGTDGSITIQLIDRTASSARSRVIRRFSLTRS